MDKIQNSFLTVNIRPSE